jgi:phosphoglycerol transferase MdoB-like AlkP superfamily enzyme
MIETLLHLVIILLVLGVVFWLIDYVLTALPVFEPFRQIARVILVVVGCIILIYLLLGLTGGTPRLPRLT